jgi:histone acetyltransferase (RNA polymerase elongator complex component)
MTKGMKVTGHLLPLPMLRMKGNLPSTVTQYNLPYFQPTMGMLKVYPHLLHHTAHFQGKMKLHVLQRLHQFHCR